MKASLTTGSELEHASLVLPFRNFASDPGHVEANLAAAEKGPLPELCRLDQLLLDGNGS